MNDGNHSHATYPADILKFDNSYSWARSKEIFYSVKLLPPGMKPHLHVPPGEMDVGGAEGDRSHNSSPTSTHSSEFYDCDDNVSKSFDGSDKQVNTELQGACSSK